MFVGCAMALLVVGCWLLLLFVVVCVWCWSLMMFVVCRVLSAVSVVCWCVPLFVAGGGDVCRFRSVVCAVGVRCPLLLLFIV